MGIDWSKAPEGTTNYGGGTFWKFQGCGFGWSRYIGGLWVYEMTSKMPQDYADFQNFPLDWPETEERINNIGRNRTEDDMGHYDDIRESEKLSDGVKEREIAEQREIEEKMKVRREIEARERHINAKYDRPIIGKYGSGKCVVDVYRVLNAFGPLSPEIDHSIKKLLAAGKRGSKDELQDLREAIQSIEARIAYLNDNTPA